MKKSITNKGDNNINLNGVKGDIYINNFPEALQHLQELNTHLMERLAVSQNQINTLLEIIKNHQNGKSKK